MVERLERAAAEALEEALADRHGLHQPGVRALHRERLERALELVGQVLAAAEAGGEVDASTLRRARLTAVLAHAARAQDARHGAGQLSQSAQRAPTTQDCALGWANVEAIVTNSETSAREAAALAAMLDDPRCAKAARMAAEAAQDARRIVDQRNHAYTFHTDPKFSFGEAWYVAAAAVLANIEVQIEPAQPHTAAAERFLSDAGLDHRLVPYRSRPRANKALPALIANAFCDAPHEAQARLRAAFLGHAPIPAVIAQWADAALAKALPTQRKVLVWVRRGVHHPARNSTETEIAKLCSIAEQHGLTPVLVGDALVGDALVGDALVGEATIDMTLFWKLPHFQSVDMRRAQLQLFEHLRRAHGLVGQIGVTTAGMDGPALMGLPTMYLTDAPNPRLGRWVGAIPNYQEITRVPGHFDRVAETLSRWAADSRRLNPDHEDDSSGVALA